MAYSLNVSKTRTLVVTEKLAKKVRDTASCPQERGLKKSRIAVLREKISSKLAIGFRWAIACCKGKEYRVEGQHTSYLLCESPDLIKEHKLYATVEYYNCDTMQDVVLLYAQFNPKLSSRSTHDINQPFAAVNPIIVKADVTPRVIDLCASAVAFAQEGHEEKYGTKEQMDVRAKRLLTKEVGEFAVFVQKIFSSLTSKEKKDLSRIPTVAAMFRTWSKNKHDANIFWKEVAHDNGTHGSPSRLLKSYLHDSIIGYAGKGRSKKKSVNHREMYIRCLLHWNAFRNGNGKVKRYFQEAPVPEVK